MRRGPSAAVALTLLTAAGAVAVGSQAAADDSHERRWHRVIDLVAEQADDTVIDLGEPGFGLGDQLLISDQLTRRGQDVGRSGGTCQLVHLDGPKMTVNCVTTLALAGGQVTAQGLLTVGGDAAGPFTAAITGGTGTFRSAEGEMIITPVDADTELYRLVFDR
jgi:hypothetical protein